MSDFDNIQIQMRISTLSHDGGPTDRETESQCAVTSNCPPLLMDGAGVYRVDVPLRTSHIAHLNASAEFL